MPAQGQKSWDSLELRLPACSWAVAMPAQRQKSWDCPDELGRESGHQQVAMPAQGQKSWDKTWRSTCLITAPVAMPAQGQKSWDS